MMRERSGWRELDSSDRSRGRPRRSRGIGSRLRRLSVGGESSRADMSPSRNLLSRSTDGSNPASSSGESAANLASSPRRRHSRHGGRAMSGIHKIGSSRCCSPKEDSRGRAVTHPQGSPRARDVSGTLAMHLRPDMSRPAKLCADTRQVGVSPLCLGGPFGSEIEPPAIWQREIDGDPRCERYIRAHVVWKANTLPGRSGFLALLVQKGRITLDAVNRPVRSVSRE
jgi:hypothetical protein